MEKPLYKSMTIWAGAFAIMYAAYQLATTGTIDPEAVITFLMGMGFIGARRAIA